MEFEWDDEKNRENLRKHGFDFADAEELLSGGSPFLVAADEHDVEDRWRGIGMIRTRVVVAIFTPRTKDVIRIISLCKANQEERKHCEEAIKNQLGPD